MSESAPDPRPGAATLVELARNRAEERPDAPAFTFLVEGKEPGGQLTFSGLDRRARAIAAHLQTLGAAGERALMLYAPGLDFIAAFVGCAYAGACAIPVPPPDALRLKRTLPRLQSVADDSRATLVLTTSAMIERLGEFDAQLDGLRRLRWVATDAIPEDRASGWSDPGSPATPWPSCNTRPARPRRPRASWSATTT